MLIAPAVLLGCSPPVGELRVDRGLEALRSLADVAELSSSRYRQFSSAQRSEAVYLGVDRGNKDFNNFLAVCGRRRATLYQESSAGPCDAGADGYLIAAADDGPGYVSRIWLTTPRGFSGERIRVYVDGRSRPVIDASLGDWQAGRGERPFAPPLTMRLSGAVISYVPISYTKRLRVLLDGLALDQPYFYQVDRRSAEAPTLPYDARRFDGATFDGLRGKLDQGLESRHLATTMVDRRMELGPGADAVVMLKGPATIRTFSLILRGLGGGELDKELELAVTWDDQPVPAIRGPVSALFGVYQAARSFHTAALSAERSGDSLTVRSTLPMPFFETARIRLRNRGARRRGVILSIAAERRAPRRPWGYLHGEFLRRRAPAPARQRYEVAGVAGRGRYVGTLLYLAGRADGRSPIVHPLNMLEGDELGRIDGVDAIVGTGTEDYFNGGFYFSDGTFDHAFASMSFLGFDARTGVARLTASRWHLGADALDFSRSFSLSFEIGASRPEILEEYSSVAYYYIDSTR